MAKRDFLSELAQAGTEEDVKLAYKVYFNLPKGSTRNGNDYLTKHVLYEFKFNKRMKSRKALARILAQALYYVRRIKYKSNRAAIPIWIALANKDEFVATETENWIDYCDKNFNWDCPPSSPDTKLVEALQADAKLDKIIVRPLKAELALVEEKIKEIEKKAPPRCQKIITAFNFENAFIHWRECFGEYLALPALAKYFRADLNDETEYNKAHGTLVFHLEKKEEFAVPAAIYEDFWLTYHRPPAAQVRELIRSKQDRLNNIDQRRLEGEFYTPLPFAELALRYLEETLGENWQDEYYIWDMACGTGNLEYHLSKQDKLFMSTLEAADVKAAGHVAGEATIFQYDYLNDDVDLVVAGADLLDDSKGWKLPRKLREALADKNKKWVVLINPPFGEAGDGAAAGSKKAGISDTKINSALSALGLGKAGRELFVQFMWRVCKELPACTLGIFATLKYINAQSFEKFRADVFKAEFRHGFMFPAKAFKGTKGAWPVSFGIWSLGAGRPMEEQHPFFEIYDLCKHSDEEKPDEEHIGGKIVEVVSKKQGLNKWTKCPKSMIPTVPMTSAIKLCTKNIRAEKLVAGALGYLSSHSNDIQNSNFTFCLSSVYGTGCHGGTSITPEIFDKAIATWAVRRLIKPTWYNDRDQFKQPCKPLPAGLINDFLIWCLFNGSNQTSSLKDVPYDGKLWQVKNHFFPFVVGEIRSWEMIDTVYDQLRTAKNTFVADRLKLAGLSGEAAAVLNAGRAIYKLYFASLRNLNRRKYKLDNWDVGWYQVRMSLREAGLGEKEFAALKTAYAALTAKLVPMVYEYGFLSKTELFPREEEEEENRC